MGKAWLTGIDQARMAFSRLPTPAEKQVADALKVLRSSEADASGMGFHTGRAILDLAEIKRTVTEHGLRLDNDQFQQTLEYMKALDKRNRARSRFIVQIGVSVALFALASIILFNGSDDLAKGAFGLIGLVAGYWLR